MPALLAIVLALAAPLRIEGEVGDVDLAATRAGVEVRLGEQAAGWQVEVRDAAGTGNLDIALTAPDGHALRRIVTLEGHTTEARSRELAATLAVIIKGDHGAATPPHQAEAEAEPEPEPEPMPLGWLAVGGRIGAGPPGRADVDYGATLRGGAWLVDDHVQPLAELGWIHTPAGGLHLDGFRLGAGAAFGGAVARRRVWLGAGAVPRAMLVRASNRAAVYQWTSSTELAVLGQLRLRRLVVGLRLGLELGFPPIRAQGERDTVRWGPARFVVGIEVGPAFLPRNR